MALNLISSIVIIILLVTLAIFEFLAYIRFKDDAYKTEEQRKIFGDLVNGVKKDIQELDDKVIYLQKLINKKDDDKRDKWKDKRNPVTGRLTSGNR